MTRFLFFLLLSFLSVTLFIVQRSSCVLADNQKNRNPGGKSSLSDEIMSFTGKIQKDADQLRCPENWTQFLYSCYFLSDYMSTVKQANQRCNLNHLKNSRLMYIQQPIELFYAAYILIKNNLNELLLEIDQDSMKGGKITNMLSSNDHVQWEEFVKKISQDNLKNYKEKAQLSKLLSPKYRFYDESMIEQKSTPVTKNEMDNDNKDQNKFKNIGHLYKPCHQIIWNVGNEESNILILTVEMESNKSICSLSNIDLRAAYSHLCQYELDRCLNNIACGAHGRCVNTQLGFNCSCSFLYDGSFCQKLSINNIELIIGFITIVVTLFVTCTQPRKFIFDIIKWFIGHWRQQPTTPPAPAPAPALTLPLDPDLTRALDPAFAPALDTTVDFRSAGQSREDENNHMGSPSDERIEWPSIPPERDKNKFKLTKEEQRLRNKFLPIFTAVFLLFFFKFPVIHHVKLAQLNNTNLSKIDSLTDDNVHLIGQYKRYTFLRTDNFIFLIISGLLVFIFSILIKKEKRDTNEDDEPLGIMVPCLNIELALVEPIKLLRITDRWPTTWIIVIQMLEILGVLEETVIDIDESAQYGIFVQIFKRIFFVILIALRYYPTLSSLQFQNFFVRLLIVIYFLGSTAYMNLYGSSGMNGLLVLIKMLSSTQRSLHIDRSSWSFAHGLIRNILHCILIGYICSELIMRLLYDSIHIDHEKKRFIRDSKINAATGENNNTGNGNVDQQGCWIRIKKYTSLIYEWDNTFRFTTIAVSTYTVAFIFLFHLTGTVILLYKTQTSSYIHYTKRIFELILNIEVKEWSSQGEVIISAIITMIIYAIQLFLSMKNYRKSIGDLYTKFSEEPDLGKKLKKREVIRKSTQYPSYLLLYLLGGFFICFHLILLFSVAIKNVILIFTHIGASTGTIGYIIPVLIVYGLQKIIIRILHKFVDHINKREESNLNWKLSTLDSIVLYLKLISGPFIGIVASIIRLIFSVLVNIIFMPRIDYSYLVEPLQWIDSAHQSFRSFIRLEMLCVYPFMLEFSRSIVPASNPGILTNRDTPAVQQLQDENGVAQNNGNSDDYTSNSEEQSPFSPHELSTGIRR